MQGADNGVVPGPPHTHDDSPPVFRAGDLLPHPVTGVLFGSPVPPGTGWPGDPADPFTPVATDPAAVTRLAYGAGLADLDARISVCRACPRLVGWREQVAADKRKSFADQPYWGRPVPGFGDPRPAILVIGLAPAANGANRTGRNFTGDRSGDWLFAALHRAGLAALPTSRHAGDGQALRGVRLVATVRCAPPDNRPTPAERLACAPWLHRELELLLPGVRAAICLGGLAWDATLRALPDLGYQLPRPKPRFGHGVEVPMPGFTLLGCYHPSQQNTFTGRLTEAMLDAVLTRAAELAGPAG